MISSEILGAAEGCDYILNVKVNWGCTLQAGLEVEWMIEVEQIK